MNNFKVSIGESKSSKIIVIYYNNKRFRFWNGTSIGVDLKSSENPTLLKAAFELKLLEGWRPKPKVKQIKEKPITVTDAIEEGINLKIAQRCSERFIKDARRVLTLWKRFETENNIKHLTIVNLKPTHIRDFLVRPNWSAKTQRTIKSTLSPLLNEFIPNLVQSVKLKKPTSTLHKPFKNVDEILCSLKDYNTHIHLCCLMTYGCLLRPHREIRELTWGDFSEDLNYIQLSGTRNKSGRNRIVPVPSYIKEFLRRGNSEDNIFSGTPIPYNEEYFKTLWSRFKRQSILIQQGQTLYSFRHSGAIELFKRTGSLTKLQKAMGHSTVNVSLTYLRGLEIAELKEEDMPMV